MAESLIDRANEEVSIIGLLRRLGVHAPEIMPGTSYKVYCPFGLTHGDHGLSKAMRIYVDTNSCHCFAECGYLDPVRLAALAWDMAPLAAAERLLEEAGVDLRPPVVWTPPVEPPPDRVALAEALRVYVRRSYGARFDTSETLERAISLLGRVHSATDASLWLTECKLIMDRTCNVTSAE